MFGFLLGGRLSPNFSMSAELRFDDLNFRNVPADSTRSVTEGDIAFSPLFHVQFAVGEFVIGPKFGVFSYEENDTMNGLSTGQITETGTSYGVNAGAFFAVSRIMSLGGMVSYTVRDPSQQCFTPPNGSKGCTNANYPAENVLGFHAGMLF